MGDVYQRLLGAPLDLDPGQWTKEGAAENKAVIRCKKCGCVDAIGGAHEIQRDGRVAPAWHCETETCGAVWWLYLEAWEP